MARRAAVAPRRERQIAALRAPIRDAELEARLTEMREIGGRSGRDRARSEIALRDCVPSTWQSRYREELEALDADPYGVQFQRIIQSDSHAQAIR